MARVLAVRLRHVEALHVRGVARHAVAEHGRVVVEVPVVEAEAHLGVEALDMMHFLSIYGLFVVDRNGHPIGALNALDLIRARIL